MLILDIRISELTFWVQLELGNNTETRYSRVFKSSDGVPFITFMKKILLCNVCIFVINAVKIEPGGTIARVFEDAMKVNFL